jgi:hypothetical protein
MPKKRVKKKTISLALYLGSIVSLVLKELNRRWGENPTRTELDDVTSCMFVTKHAGHFSNLDVPLF